MELVLRDNYPIEECEKSEIDTHIDTMIARHKGDEAKVNLWTMEAVSIATAVEARSDELENQGLLSRMWNSFTGSNQKLSARNQGDLARAQYLSQNVLSKLAEQNAITFEVAVAVSEKMNLLAKDYAATKEGLANLYAVLGRFFGQVREKIEALEHEFRRNDDLLFWKETILEHKVYQNRLYSELAPPEKLVCLVNEFLSATKGHWSSRDLAFLKSTMRTVGLAPEEEVLPLELHRYYQAEPALLDRLLLGTGIEDLSAVASSNTPLMLGFAKLEHLRGESRYLIDTLDEITLDIPREEIELSLLKNYLKQHTGRSLEAALPAYDAVLELIGDLLMCQSRQEAEALRQETDSAIAAEDIAQTIARREEFIRQMLPQPAQVPFSFAEGTVDMGKDEVFNLHMARGIRLDAIVSKVLISEGQMLSEGDNIAEIRCNLIGTFSPDRTISVKSSKYGLVKQVRIKEGDEVPWEVIRYKNIEGKSYELFSFEPTLPLLRDELVTRVENLLAVESGS